MKTTKSTLPRPLPATASVPEAGRIFFGANRARSYRLAQQGAIVTLEMPTKAKIALLHPTAIKLGIDPKVA
jgi:hypothetical protein